MPSLLDAVSLERQLKDAKAYNQQAIFICPTRGPADARLSFEEPLRFEPDSAKGHINLGNSLLCQGKFDCAVASYQRALYRDANSAEAYSNLGNSLLALGRYEEAITNCQQALRIEPNNASVLNNLGIACKGIGKLDEAVSCYERALALNPKFPEACNNLGVALAGLNKLDEAVANYTEALRLRPDYVDPYYNLGMVFIQREDWDEAVVVLQQAVGLRPDHAEAYYCLGNALGEQGKSKKAAKCFQEALRLKPDYTQAHWGLAFTQLIRGEFEQGWTEYEWRLRHKDFSLRPFEKPFWDGSGLTGRTILLHAEQGLGDTIQFVRYARLAKEYGGTVILECKTSLLPLLSSCPGIDRLVAAGSELPPFDAHAPLLSLPGILKTSLSTVPAEIPYLCADTQLQAKWQCTLNRFSGFRVGIAWQGNPQVPRDHLRSIPLIHFAPLARVEGVCLFSLQKGPGTKQLLAIRDQFTVIDLGNRLDENSGAFMDTAALMRNVDLVITSDTAIAHLAGALGVPVWVALPYVGEWRWLLQREDSPWYSSMRLFRQPEPADWDGVFDRMAQELTKRVQACAQRGC